MPEPVVVRVQVLAGRPPLALPAYATEHSAGMDLPSAEERVLGRGERHAFSTGLALEIPEGFEVQVRPRSGLALKHGVTVLNAPGTIDADYRGEVRVILVNHGTERYIVRVGDRIAQLVVAPVCRGELMLVTTIESSQRGEGGFGHTGR